MNRDIEKALKEPFAEEDLEWRVQSSGKKKNGDPWIKCLVYVQSRAVMDRLDEVFGVTGWSSEITKVDGGFLCTITVDEKDGKNKTWTMTSKQDGSELTKVEPFKGGISGAVKRAGVQWGIGRYLYNITENFAVITKNGKYSSKIGDNWVKWNPPKLPSWALPQKETKAKKTRKSKKEESEVNDAVVQNLEPKDLVESLFESIDRLQIGYEHVLEYFGFAVPEDKSLLTRTNMEKKLLKSANMEDVESYWNELKKFNGNKETKND